MKNKELAYWEDECQKEMESDLNLVEILIEFVNPRSFQFRLEIDN